MYPYLKAQHCVPLFLNLQPYDERYLKKVATFLFFITSYRKLSHEKVQYHMDILQEKEIEQLYKTFRKPLLRYISYKVADKQHAEEILNDVFFKAANSIESLNEKAKRVCDTK